MHKAFCIFIAAFAVGAWAQSSSDMERDDCAALGESAKILYRYSNQLWNSTPGTTWDTASMILLDAMTDASQNIGVVSKMSGCDMSLFDT